MWLKERDTEQGDAVQGVTLCPWALSSGGCVAKLRAQLVRPAFRELFLAAKHHSAVSLCCSYVDAPEELTPQHAAHAVHILVRRQVSELKSPAL